jgi:hypothetical protein
LSTKFELGSLRVIALTVLSFNLARLPVTLSALSVIAICSLSANAVLAVARLAASRLVATVPAETLTAVIAEPKLLIVVLLARTLAKLSESVAL